MSGGWWGQCWGEEGRLRSMRFKVLEPGTQPDEEAEGEGGVGIASRRADISPIAETIPLTTQPLGELTCKWKKARRGDEMIEKKSVSQVDDATLARSSKGRSGGFLLLIPIGLAIVLIGFGFYQLYLLNTAANDGVTAVLGQRGDFFGGFLNPILTALTLCGLFYTLHLQRAEQHEAREQFEISSKALSDQNEMIRQQNYQAGFFQLLAIHNDLVNSLKIFDSNEKIDAVGRDAFGVMYSRLVRKYLSKKKQYPNSDDMDVLIFAWDDVFREN